MSRLILFILLITVVYSWEEFKHVLLVLWSRLRNKHSTHQKNSASDSVVSDILIVATIPFTLAFLLLSEGSIIQKFLVIFGELIILGLALKGWEEYSRRRHFTRDYEGADIYIAHAFSLIGLVSPSWKFATKAAGKTSRTASYIFVLSLPLLFGLFLAWAAQTYGSDVLDQHLDLLIQIAVLGLVMSITIEVLEKMFKLYRLHMSGLLRILLGLVIIFALQAKL